MSIAQISSHDSLNTTYLQWNEIFHETPLVQKTKLFFLSLFGQDDLEARMAAKPVKTTCTMNHRIVKFIQSKGLETHKEADHLFSIEKILKYINAHKTQFQYILNKSPHENLTSSDLLKLHPIGSSDLTINITDDSDGSITTTYQNDKRLKKLKYISFNGTIEKTYIDGTIKKEYPMGFHADFLHAQTWYTDGRICMEFYHGGLYEKVEKFPDGSINKKYPNGDFRMEFPKRYYPGLSILAITNHTNGSRKTEYYEGDLLAETTYPANLMTHECGYVVKEYRDDGRLVAEYDKKDLSQYLLIKTQYQDGRIEKKYRNGIIRIEYPEGYSEQSPSILYHTTYPDCHTRTEYRSGYVLALIRYSNGSCVTEYREGDLLTFTRHGGTIEIKYRNGRTCIYHDEKFTHAS